jgi:hypothetical protein
LHHTTTETITMNTSTTEAAPSTEHKDPLAWIKELGGQDLEFKIRCDYACGTGALDGWSASAKPNPHWPHNELSKHIELPGGRVLMLSIRPSHERASINCDLVAWSSVLLVAEGRYVRTHGKAKNLPTVLAEVTQFAHASRDIGGITWWQESESRWVSWIGGSTLRAMRFKDSSDSPEYWNFEINGHAPSFEEAALLATLRN